MALNAYLRVKGQKQGDIKGGTTQKGREGTIAVHEMSHDIVSPRDPASGLPTGKRMHKPLVITKDIDRSSPLLLNALVNNENLVSFRLDFYEQDATGMEKNSYRIELTNASIASIETRMPNNKNPELARYAAYEEVAFTYQKIAWTWVDGGLWRAMIGSAGLVAEFYFAPVTTGP